MTNMIDDNDLRYLHIAENIAKNSDYKRIHIGAILVNKNKVISTGFNQNKTHPIQKIYNNRYLNYKKIKGDKLHAEVDVLLKLNKKDCNGSTMYIFRRGNDNIYRLSKPCKACMQCILDYGIKRIVYTIENGIKEIYL